MSKSSKHLLREKATQYRAGAVPGAGLELPDWSGHIERPSKVGADEMLRYCESLLPRVKKFPGHRNQRRAGGCPVEFVLK